MPFKHGRSGELWLGGLDISPYFASADPDAKADVADVTTFKSTWHNFVVGQASAQMSATGFYDPANVGTTLFATLGAAPGVLTVFPAGAVAIGDIGWPLSYNSAHLKEGSKMIGGAVSMDWSVTATSTVSQGVCLLPLSVQNVGTNNNTGDGILTSASSSTGAIATAHVTAYTSGSQTIKFQDSTTLGGAYTDIASGAFPAITATGGYRLVIPGTIRQFVRCVTIIAGAQITVGVAFART